MFTLLRINEIHFLNIFPLCFHHLNSLWGCCRYRSEKKEKMMFIHTWQINITRAACVAQCQYHWQFVTQMCTKEEWNKIYYICAMSLSMDTVWGWNSIQLVLVLEIFAILSLIANYFISKQRTNSWVKKNGIRWIGWAGYPSILG